MNLNKYNPIKFIYKKFLLDIIGAWGNSSLFSAWGSQGSLPNRHLILELEIMEKETISRGKRHSSWEITGLIEYIM